MWQSRWSRQSPVSAWSRWRGGAVARFKRLVGCQRLDDRDQVSVQRLGVLPLLLPLVVALEPPEAFNRPH